MEYNEYLIREGYTTSTQKHFNERIEMYSSWCKKTGNENTQMRYAIFLKYIAHLKRKNYQPQTISNHLATLKNYYSFLERYHATTNPTEDITIRGTINKVVYNPLSNDQLEDMYYRFSTENIRCSNHRLYAKKNKVILGLMIYQGLNATTIKQLREEHFDLYKGKINVPSTLRSNERELPLQSWQLLPLLEYINEVRPTILKHNYVSISEECFFDVPKQINNVLFSIIKKLQKINPQLEGANHLRSSVIINWLKQYDLRKVQYMAGHKYISSTEKYQESNLEELQKSIELYHPLK
jgi:integrase/recombinase XerD